MVGSCIAYTLFFVAASPYKSSTTDCHNMSNISNVDDAPIELASRNSEWNVSDVVFVWILFLGICLLLLPKAKNEMAAEAPKRLRSEHGMSREHQGAGSGSTVSMLLTQRDTTCVPKGMCRAHLHQNPELHPDPVINANREMVRLLRLLFPTPRQAKAGHLRNTLDSNDRELVWMLTTGYTFAGEEAYVPQTPSTTTSTATASLDGEEEESEEEEDDNDEDESTASTASTQVLYGGGSFADDP